MSSEAIKLTLPLTPISKKNSQQILINNRTGKPFIAPSQNYKIYERDCMYFLNRCTKPIDYPINLKCVFYMPTNRRCDLVNMLEAVCDVLVKAKVIEDDNYTIVAAHDGSRVEYDKNNPRTEITISRLSE